MSTLETDVDGRDDETLPGSWRVNRLRRAQRDLYRLLAFATEQGPCVEDETIRHAVEIGRIDPDEITIEQEQLLWRMRSLLSKVVQPAHASGLRFMDLIEAQSPETAEPRALRGWSGKWLLVAVLAVASVHSYSVVGQRLVLDSDQRFLLEAGSVEQMLDPRAHVAPTMTQGVPMPAVGVVPIAAADSAAGFGVATVGPSPGKAAQFAAADHARHAVASKDASAGETTNAASAGQLNALIGSLQISLDGHRQRIETWNSVWRTLLMPFTSPLFGVASIHAAMPTDVQASDVPPDGALDRLRKLKMDSILPLKAETYAANVAQSTIIQYLLPMLYGALGAFVFVVRRVTNDIDRGSLRTLLRIRYRIRLLLGAIFGLTVAMATTEWSHFRDTIPLSAVALAFVAGYGIDAAFGLLDAIIDRLRQALVQGPQPPASGGALVVTP